VNLTTPPQGTLKDKLQSMRPHSSLSSEDLESVYAFGFNWLELREFDKARSAFEILWQSRPDHAAYAAGLAQSALGQGQSDVAVSYFLLAIELDEKNAGYMLGLGQAFQACELPGHARLAYGLTLVLAQEIDDQATARVASALLSMGAST
jgi:tetratricopeptide (TPR) repeat protein